MSLSPFGYMTLFTLLFLAVGAFLLWRVWRGRRELVRLLAEGCFARGRLVELNETGTVINGQAVMDARVAFADALGAERTAGCRVMAAAADRCRRWRDEGADVGLLYMPDQPGTAYIADLMVAE